MLQQVALFIGNDSGLGHMAAACNTPTLTVFGPGDPARYHPWHPRARRVESDSGDIADIPVAVVVAAVLDMELHKDHGTNTAAGEVL